ncbi:hypothetical protein D3C84_1173430 [compost metagenome]
MRVQNTPTSRSHLFNTCLFIIFCAGDPISGDECVSHPTGNRTIFLTPELIAFHSYMTSRTIALSEATSPGEAIITLNVVAV